MDMTGKTVLITGASRGIGRVTAIRLAQAGADVHVLARSESDLRSLAAEVGGRAWTMDITDDADVWTTLDSVMDAAGRPPDLIVNSAGVFDVAPVAETSVALFDRNIDVNLRGAFLVVRAVLPALLEVGRGLIVNVGSVSGRRAFPGNGAYSASKFGLRGLHEVMVEELRGTGVRATLLEPAATDTEIWDPLDPDADPGLPNRSDMLRPADVAETVLFLATRPDHVHIPFLPVQAG